VKVFSGLLRVLAGVFLLIFATSRYGSLQPDDPEATAQLFGQQISLATLQIIIYSAFAIGALLLVLGAVTLLRKKTPASSP
jgi:hypothetical protein